MASIHIVEVEIGKQTEWKPLENTGLCNSESVCVCVCVCLHVFLWGKGQLMGRKEAKVTYSLAHGAHRTVLSS